MKQLSAYLLEATEAKNLHIEHVEDLIFDGPAATQVALSMLYVLGEILRDGTATHALSLSVKWDGSPAVVFGPDPVDGRFFVGTKSVFIGKVAHSHAEIDALYPSVAGDPDGMVGANPILHVCFDELQTVHPGVVLQGDVLFISDGVVPQTIADRDYFTFTPNTLTYAVPAASDVGWKVSTSRLGIALHTMYVGTGDVLADYSATNLDSLTFAGLRPSLTVWLVDANFDDLSGEVQFDAQDAVDFDLAIEQASLAVERLGGLTIADSRVRSELARFINDAIKTSQRMGFNEFVLFLISRQEQAVAARQSEQGKEAAAHQYLDIVSAVYGMETALTYWFQLHAALTRAKLVLIRKLETASPIKTFVFEDGHYRETGPEGFVVTAGNQVVKLVDRREFSRLNFLHPRTF